MPHIKVVIADFLGCGYYRCVLPYQKLTQYGYNITVTNKIPFKSPNTDVIVLQRQYQAIWHTVIPHLKQQGIKVIYETDDLLHDVPLNNPCRRMYLPGSNNMRNLDGIISLCDGLMASTPQLAQFYQDRLPTYVGYNALDDTIFAYLSALPKPPKDEFLRIGWAGSGTHLDDVKQIVSPLAALMEEYPHLRFVFMGADYKEIFPSKLRSRIEHAGTTYRVQTLSQIQDLKDNQNIGQSIVDYYKLLAGSNIDIAIAPLSSHRFNRAKSFCKLFEYGLARIPFVASHVGPYGQYVGNYSWHQRYEQCGLTAGANSEWKRNLKALIEDANLRQALAANNLEKVKTQHLVSQNVTGWLDAFKTLGIGTAVAV